jgi:hypothetical protein
MTYFSITVTIWSTSYFVYWWVNVLKLISFETIDWLVPVGLLLILIWNICVVNGEVIDCRKNMQKLLQQNNDNMYHYVSEYIVYIKVFDSLDINYNLFTKIIATNIAGFIIKLVLYLLNI